MTELFKYMDYRKYLKDFFDEKKAMQPSFSHRAFARAAGFSSSNFLLLVMQGKRNLSGDGILKVSKALKHKKAEAEFFENLVRFNQSASDTERNFHYSRIAANRRYSEARPLEKGQFEYYSKWYVPVIREMILLKNFRDDPEWIAAKLKPQITPREAAAALKLLFDLGLIERDPAGRIVQKEKHITSGDEVASLAMTNFQREMIEKAAKSIDDSPPDQREIGSVTFAVSKEKFMEAKKMIREFRTRLAGFLAEESAAEAVCQFNFQLFGLSTAEKDRGVQTGDRKEGV